MTLLPKSLSLAVACASSVLSLSIPAQAQKVVSVTEFASGTAVNGTNPDSICYDGKSIWIEYADDSVSTGGGHSTVVQYDLKGNVMQTFTIAGSVDGLKPDGSGMIWALQNQDGNSTLTLINPKTGIVPGSPFTYAVQSAIQGYDDVAFVGGKAFLSHTNPAAPTDAILQSVDNIKSPISVTDVLLAGATGTNLATGQTGQALPDADPDSLKTTPGNGLMLTSAHNGYLLFVNAPPTQSQAVSFLQLVDSTGADVSGLDDCKFVGSTTGTFYVSDTSNNRVLAIKMERLTVGSLYGSVGSLNAFSHIDQKTGLVTPVVTIFNGPHGVLFLEQ